MTMASGAQGVQSENRNQSRQGVAALAIGAVGVVYGDIGTSPIYALREA